MSIRCFQGVWVSRAYTCGQCQSLARRITGHIRSEGAVDDGSGVLERTCTNGSDAIADDDAGQTGTFLERTFPNGSDAIADGDAGQAGIIERPTANGSDAIRDGDAGQTGTPLERIIPNVIYAIRDGDAGQTGTPLERTFPNGSDAIRDGDMSIGGSVKTFSCCKCRFQKKQRNNKCQAHILITCHHLYR